MIVKQHPPRADIAGHFILLPKGPRYVCGKNKAFPLGFLSGRTLELFVENGELQRVPEFWTVPVDPALRFPDDVLQKLLRESGSLGGDAASSDLASLVNPLTVDDVVPIPTVPFDDANIRRDVEQFHQDNQRVRLELWVPRVTPEGQPFWGRQQALAELRAWMNSLGLRCEEQRNSRRDKDDLFLVNKAQAFADHA